MDEIYDQVKSMDQQSRYYYGRPLSNIVFMGMGEPLMNYKNMIASIEKITQPDGLAISPSRITVSTSGIPKMIIKMADDGVKFSLPVSLHSARQSVREQLMAFAKKFPLNELVTSIKYWYEKTSKPVTYEYIVWKKINDKKEDTPPENYKERPWYKKLKETKKSFFTSIYKYLHDDQWGISYITPQLKKDGTFVGAFCVDISLDKIDKVISTLNISTNTSVILYDNKGKALFATGPIFSESKKLVDINKLSLPKSVINKVSAPGDGESIAPFIFEENKEF